MRGFHAAAGRVRPRLLRQAAAMVGPNDAEDVVQEALVRAWRLTRIRPKNWESWLFRITVNTAKNWLRARQMEIPMESVDSILERWNSDGDA